MIRRLLPLFSAWTLVSSQDLKPPTPEGTETELLVAYILQCEPTEFMDLKEGDSTNTLKLVASEQCQGDPFNDYSKALEVWCQPNEVLEFRSYDNINCRGAPSRVSRFTNGYCDAQPGQGGFAANWNKEHWDEICAPPGVDDSETKGEFCRGQTDKGRKECLRWNCCTWTDEGECGANAKKCTDRKKVSQCTCPNGEEGVSVNVIADVNDDKQDGCSCRKLSTSTCLLKEGDDYKAVQSCSEGECYKGDIAGDDEWENITRCPDSNDDDPDSGNCCTNGLCAKCDPNKPTIGSCTDGDNRSAVQDMLLNKDFGTQLDLIGCAMSFLGQRQDQSMSPTLCNCYTAFEKEDWSDDKHCWVNDRETKSTKTQFDACEDYLGISDCASVTKQSKCNRKHQCVWSIDRSGDDGAVKKCIPAIRASSICSDIESRAKCGKKTECVWRHDEGCIANGPYSCEGLQQSKCRKQCGCFFQNPYGCRKNRHRHDIKEKDNEACN